MPEWVQRDAPEPDRLLQEAVRSRFVVTLIDCEDAFEGLLVEADDRTLILVQASSITRTGTRIGVDGALYLERGRVAYLQRTGGLPLPGGAG